MTDEQRKIIKKELREMLLLDQKEIGSLVITRVPGGFVYSYGNTAVFGPYNETCALDLDDKKTFNKE